jgi:hypothetical protein
MKTRFEAIKKLGFLHMPNGAIQSDFMDIANKLNEVIDRVNKLSSPEKKEEVEGEDLTETELIYIHQLLDIDGASIELKSKIKKLINKVVLEMKQETTIGVTEEIYDTACVACGEQFCGNKGHKCKQETTQEFTKEELEMISHRIKSDLTNTARMDFANQEKMFNKLSSILSKIEKLLK